MRKFIFGILISLSAYADAGAYTGKANVLWIGSLYGDYFVIAGDWANVMGCSNYSTDTRQRIWKIYSETGSVEDLKSMYSMALAAYMSGKTIELYSHGCDGGGTNGRPMARSIYLPSRLG